MQNSNTRHMIFHIPETIAAVSAVLTLEPGDVIAMGTPEGDVLQAEVEGLGVLKTYIV